MFIKQHAEKNSEYNYRMYLIRLERGQVVAKGKGRPEKLLKLDIIHGEVLCITAKDNK